MGSFPETLIYPKFIAFSLQNVTIKMRTGNEKRETGNEHLKQENETEWKQNPWPCQQASLLTLCFFPFFIFPFPVLGTCYPSFSPVSLRRTPSGRVLTVPLREMSGSASYPDVSLARAKEGGKECPAYRVKVT